MVVVVVITSVNVQQDFSVAGIIRLTHCKCKSLTQWSSHLSSVCRPSVCLSRIKSRKLSEIGAKFHHLDSKSGSPNKNMTSYFVPEVANYPRSSHNPQNCNFRSVQAYCLALLTMQLVYLDFID